MKNKLLLSLICIIPIIANAEEGAPFPSNVKGINYISFKDANIPEEFKGISNKKLMDSKGYVEKNEPYVDTLLNIKKIYINEIKAYKNNPDPEDTNLKESVSEIKLSIPYREISFIDKKDILGFAASNTYTKEEGKKEGWTGVGEFFVDSYLGTCHYEYHTIKAVMLDKTLTQYFINKKPSFKLIEGNPHSGFLYSLTWYTNEYASRFECANMKFDKTILPKMIEMAKKIDSQQS